MVDLARWLGAQLDADERIARAAIEAEFLTCGRWLARGPYGDDDRYGNIQSELNEQIIEDDLPWSFTEHAAEHDPARVLRETDAKRQILTEYEQAARYAKTTWGQSNADQSRARTLGEVVRLMASVYEHRPGYAEAVASIK